MGRRQQSRSKQVTGNNKQADTFPLYDAPPRLVWSVLLCGTVKPTQCVLETRCRLWVGCHFTVQNALKVAPIVHLVNVLATSKDLQTERREASLGGQSAAQVQDIPFLVL